MTLNEQDWTRFLRLDVHFGAFNRNFGKFISGIKYANNMVIHVLKSHGGGSYEIPSYSPRLDSVVRGAFLSRRDFYLYHD